ASPRDRQAVTGTQTPGHGPQAPHQQKGPDREPGASPGPSSCPPARPDNSKISYRAVDNVRRPTRGFGSEFPGSRPVLSWVSWGSGVLGLWQEEALEAVGEPGLELAGCPAVVGGQQQV